MEQVRECGVSRAFGSPRGEEPMAKLQGKIAVITGLTQERAKP
jgi:hypothetical protein